MRINKFIAAATGLSRRAADAAITEGRVLVNGALPQPGQPVSEGDRVTLDGQSLDKPAVTRTIILNKPPGYVVSRQGQGSQTIYNLLPASLHHLKPVGRLDKDSSGLLLLTNDGQMAQQLTHPRYQKTKVYEVGLDKPLSTEHKTQIEQGVNLDDGPSRLTLQQLGNDQLWRATMQEGRNRQIRRTFAALGYTVTKLHRTQFGLHKLHQLASGSYQLVA